MMLGESDGGGDDEEASRDRTHNQTASPAASNPLLVAIRTLDSVGVGKSSVLAYPVAVGDHPLAEAPDTEL